MKKIIVAVIGTVLLISALYFALRPSSFDKELQNAVDTLEHYHMSGTMEVVEGEDLKTFTIDLSWDKEGEQEFYRVSLYDQGINQEQVILKNQDGVFVLTPSLNQAFKFKGDWPSDTPKPYLYQSMLALLQGEHVSKKIDGGYIVSADVNYLNSPSLVKQEMVFDKELKPKTIKVYNADGFAEITITFDDVDMNPVFDDKYFAVDANLAKNQTVVTGAMVDLPLYPVAVYNARLTNTSVAEVGSETRHILEFTGDKSFTVVEVLRNKSEEPITLTVSGELVDGIDAFGVYDGNCLTFYNNLVEFTVYSDDLTVDEMLQVVSSMQVAIVSRK